MMRWWEEKRKDGGVVRELSGEVADAVSRGDEEVRQTPAHLSALALCPPQGGLHAAW